MLNMGYKKEAIEKFDKANKVCEFEKKKFAERCHELFELKKLAVKVLTHVDAYMNKLSNKPVEMKKRFLLFL